jgi:hypothetical protein
MLSAPSLRKLSLEGKKALGRPRRRWAVNINEKIKTPMFA